MPSDGKTYLKFLLPGICYAIPCAIPGYQKVPGYLTSCRYSLLEKLPSPGPGYRKNPLHDVFESRALTDFIDNPNGIAYSEVVGPQRFYEYAILFG